MKSQARLRLRKPCRKIAVSNSPLITFLAIKGKLYQCPCGANVFTAMGNHTYRCNSCAIPFISYGVTCKRGRI